MAEHDLQLAGDEYWSRVTQLARFMNKLEDAGMDKGTLDGEGLKLAGSLYSEVRSVMMQQAGGFDKLKDTSAYSVASFYFDAQVARSELRAQQEAAQNGQ